MLDNITRNFETESRRDQMLHNLTEGNRASLGNVRAAAEMLEYGDLPDEMRDRFRKVIRDEVQAMGQRLNDTASEFADSLKVRWPLEEMLGADPHRGGAAPHRGAHRLAYQARGGGRTPVGEGRQLLADAGADLPRKPSFRRIRGARGAFPPELGGPARSPRPDLVGPGDEHRDGHELGARADEDRRREQPADGARRHRPPRRRDVARAREGPPSCLLPHPVACRHPAGAVGSGTLPAWREPSRVLRL